MIDTGAEINIIKEKSLEANDRIDTTKTCTINGVANGCLKTLGQVNIYLFRENTTFHVVDNFTPIQQDGILGAPFFKKHSAKIDYGTDMIYLQHQKIPFYTKDILILPPRSRKNIFLAVTDESPTEGYLPRLSLGDKIYIGEAVVTKRNNRAYINAINSNEKTAIIKYSPIRLQEYQLPPEKQTCYQITSTKINTPGPRYDNLIPLLRLEHLNQEEKAEILSLIKNTHNSFHLPGEPLDKTNATTHRIITTDDIPTSSKLYRNPPVHNREIAKQIEEMINSNIITPSVSPYNSPLWIVAKKDDSKGNKRWRLVIDFRKLNEKTVGDAYPLPQINEILDQLGGAKYFSIFDLASGFHQIPMHEEDKKKTAFSTPYGHYEFNRMPFGLKNAPATFQRLMDQTLSGLQGQELFVYLDDVVIYAKSLEDHRNKYNKLIERLRNANLKLQPDKCEFLRKEVAYLGHVIDKDGVRPDPNKIIAVEKFPAPKTQTNIKQFLGLAGYYRRFIEGFSKIAKPLTNLLKKKTPFQWLEPQQEAFEILRSCLIKEPILQYPDFTKTFILTTDASAFALGAILSQGEIGKDLPIAYTSRVLNKAENNYSTIEKELLAIVHATKHFRPYLYGQRFKLITDHKPLVWLNNVKDPTHRLFRWRTYLEEYEYTICYKPGKKNSNADALSRNPIESTIINTTYTINTLHEDEANPPPTPQTEPVSSRLRSRNKPTIITKEQRDKSHQTTVDHEIEPDLIDDESEEEMDEERESLNEGPILPTQGIKENIVTQKGNIMIFMTPEGNPVDYGAQLLRKYEKLPDISKQNPRIGDMVTTRIGKTTYFSLIIKGKEGLLESLNHLNNWIIKHKLESISVSESPEGIYTLSWQEMKNLISASLEKINIKLLICKNIISIPEPTLRLELITEAHASTIGGHKGVTKTYSRLKEKYKWDNMKTEVKIYIKNCTSCQRKKLIKLKTKQPMIITDTPFDAFDKVALDIVGPLPSTKNGYSHILTIQDALTKYCIAVPLKETNAGEVANAMAKYLITQFGTPRCILTDQGSNFMSALIKSLAKCFKIKQIKTTAYHPQSNGSLERSHRVLGDYLRQYITMEKEWSEWINFAMFSYNTSVHESTQFTPFELIYGRIARIPSAFSNDKIKTYHDHVQNLIHKLQDVRYLARENLLKAKEKSKIQYDKKINIQEFKPGDWVYLLKENRKGKLDDHYIGPYLVKNVEKNHNVKIQIKLNRTKAVHANRLKLAYVPEGYLGPHA